MSEETQNTASTESQKSGACCAGKSKPFILIGGLIVLALVGLGFATNMLPNTSATTEVAEQDKDITFDPEEGPSEEVEIAGQVLKPGNPVVAVLDGEEIKRSDVLEFIAQLPEQMRQGPVTMLFPMALEQTINARLLEEKAAAADTASREDVQEQIAEAKKNIIRTAYVQQLVNDGVSDKKVQERYVEYIAQVPEMEEIKARHILVETEEKANELIQQLNSGASFEELAKENSIGPTGENGGDLGYFSKEQMVPEFSDAAFSITKGEYSKTPVKTQFGWHVIKVEDKRTKDKPSLEEIRPFIETEIKRDVLDEALEEWKAGKEIVMYDINGEPLAETEAPAADENAAEAEESTEQEPVSGDTDMEETTTDAPAAEAEESAE